MFDIFETVKQSPIVPITTSDAPTGQPISLQFLQVLTRTWQSPEACMDFIPLFPSLNLGLLLSHSVLICVSTVAFGDERSPSCLLIKHTWYSVRCLFLAFTPWFQLPIFFYCQCCLRQRVSFVEICFAFNVLFYWWIGYLSMSCMYIMYSGYTPASQPPLFPFSPTDWPSILRVLFLWPCLWGWFCVWFGLTRAIYVSSVL